MADFGNKGIRTITEAKVAVQISLATGEYLQIKVTALGAVPVFNWSCTHHTLWDASEFPGHPQMNYEKRWPQIPSDHDSDHDVFVLAFSFLTAVEYTYVINHCDSKDKVIAVLKDITIASDDANDSFHEPLTIFVKSVGGE